MFSLKRLLEKELYSLFPSFPLAFIVALGLTERTYSADQ